MKVALHTENGSGEEASPIEFNIACSNIDDEGGWYVDSTYNQNDPFRSERSEKDC